MIDTNSPLAVGLREFPMTLGLVVACIGLFIWQVLTGVDASQPQNADLLKWGANFLPYSLGNQPWRLLSSLFLHIGLLHLMFNTFALYYFGQVAERMFGSLNLLILFLLSGLGGNLLNNYLGLQKVLADDIPAVSAGASGGIMGIGMALLTVAVLKKPINGMLLSAQSLIWVMAINLGYGFLVSGIDNAGHVGGAITGVMLAMAFIFQYAKQNDISQNTLVQKKSWLANHAKLLECYLVLLAMYAVIYWQLHHEFMALLGNQYAQVNI